MEDIKTRSVNAFKWTALNQITSQTLGIIFNIILARLLSPQDFGYFALPFVVYMFFRLLMDFGFTEVMIKEVNDDKNILHSSVYWFMVFIGVICSLISFSLSPLIAYWSKADEAGTINQWLSISILISAFIGGFDAMIRKKLEYKKAFYIEIFSNLISGIAALYVALQTGIWHALIVKNVLYIALCLLLTLIIFRWRPNFVLDKKLMQRHLGFATSNITEQILNFITRNADTILISRFLGANPMGIYDRANKFLTLPITQISGVFTKMMLPTMIHHKDDNQISNTYLKICALISLVSFPMMLGLFAVAEDFTILLFGIHWKGMIPLLKIFCIISLFQSISSVGHSIYYLKNKADALLKFTIFTKPFYLLAIVSGLYFHSDIYYIALYSSFASIIIAILFLNQISGLLKFEIKTIWQVTFPQLLASCIMVAIIYLFKYLFKDQDLYLRLTVCIIAGIFSYYLLIFLSKNKAYIHGKSLILHAIKN